MNPNTPSFPLPAVQMYTIRDFTATAEGLADSLARIAQIGYRAVQLSAVGAMNGASPQVSPEQARRMLDDNGLRCIATHRGWSDLAERTEQEIQFHQTLGCDYVAIGGLPEPFKSDGLDGCRRWIAEAAPVITRLKAAGIQFGYHNHAFEFAAEGPDRRRVYDVLLAEGGHDLMLELDVYWAAYAGFNPERLIEQAAGRLPVVHLKDAEVVGNDPVMAPVGEGNLDWPNLLPALQAAGTEWLCVEQDVCRRDPFDCLRSSLQFLNRFQAAL